MGRVKGDTMVTNRHNPPLHAVSTVIELAVLEDVRAVSLSSRSSWV